MRKGDIGSFIEEHDLTYLGDHPVNTDGGQLSSGQLNPGGASGCIQIVETARQLMGRSHEEGHGVDGARLGFWNT